MTAGHEKAESGQRLTHAPAGRQGKRTLTLRADSLNPVYMPFLHDTHRYQLFYGGAASGKSVFLATRAAVAALEGRNVLIVRKVFRTLRTSCMNEVKKAIGRLNADRYFTLNRSDAVLSARNGAQIIFMGMDDAEKVKSVTPQQGVLTDIWVEEATELDRAELKQLDKRLRGLSPFPKRLTLSLNPVSKSHWIYREFFDGCDEEKQVSQTDSTLFVRTSFRDNRFLTDEDRQALLAERDPYFRRVYTDGAWGIPADAVFTNWRVADTDGDISGETRMGLDFGFSTDHCGFVRALYDRRARRIFVTDEMYERGLTNRALYERLKPVCGPGLILCDSAEPKSIRELCDLGLYARPARKGPDSVMYGLQWLRGHEIIVSPRCRHMRNELSAYCFKKDRDGVPLPYPEDRNNHLIDALRYALACDMEGRYARTESGG